MGEGSRGTQVEDKEVSKQAHYKQEAFLVKYLLEILHYKHNFN